MFSFKCGQIYSGNAINRTYCFRAFDLKKRKNFYATNSRVDYKFFEKFNIKNVTRISTRLSAPNTLWIISLITFQVIHAEHIFSNKIYFIRTLSFSRYPNRKFIHIVMLKSYNNRIIKFLRFWMDESSDWLFLGLLRHCLLATLSLSKMP